MTRILVPENGPTLIPGRFTAMETWDRLRVEIAHDMAIDSHGPRQFLAEFWQTAGLPLQRGFVPS